MGSLSKANWSTFNGNRYSGHGYAGFTGDHVQPTRFIGNAGRFGPPLTLPNGARQPTIDIPNLPLNHLVHSAGVNSCPAARNKAWSELVESVRQGSASLAVTLAEMPKSANMIANRALQLYRGYRNLRRGNFRGFLREFDVPPMRRHRNWTSNAVNRSSSLWLEYSFGWKPLVGDIYNAVNVMGQPMPGGRVSGSGRETYIIDNSGSISSGKVFKLYGYIACKQGADVYVSNPNHFLLQSLGLANPAVVAWELVPFSFLADWVFDVQSFLGGFTDLYGCTVLNGYTTVVGKARGTVSWKWVDGRLFTVPGHTVATERFIGLSRPMPNVQFTSNIGSSLTRAANAVSLLGQILTK